MRKRPCVLCACVFLTGLAYERYQTAAFLLVPAILLLQEFFFGIRFRKWKQTTKRSMLLLFVFLFGMARMSHEEGFRDACLSKLEDGDSVTIWGEIKTFETAEFGSRCILTDCYIRINEEVERTSLQTSSRIMSGDIISCNDVMVYTSSAHFQVGEIHEITGEFQHFSTAGNQGNFDSQVFYQSQKVDFIVEEESGRLLGNNLNPLEEGVLFLKEKLKNIYETCMEAKTAGFYTGMILGDRSNLEDSIKELFMIGGISHILAISGLHVSMIGRQFYQLLRKIRLGFVAAALAAGGVLLAYCYMAGSGMSAVRAVGMMLLFFLAQCMGRSYDMLNGLGGMCILLLWENPILLEYSGFWFSVLALIGVGFTGKTLSEQVKWGKSFWMSMGITLATLPVVAYCYYEIPLYSPVVNMIVLPVLTPVFLLAVIGGMVGLWLPEAAKLFFLPCGWLLEFYEWICGIVSSLPGAAIVSGEPGVTMIVVYYVVLALGVLCLRWRQRKKEIGKGSAVSLSKKQEKKFVITDFGKKEWIKNIWHSEKWAMAVLCFVCFTLIIYPKEKPFEITFLDVGQGDGIYISTGDGTTCFIDGGSSSASELGKYRLLPFLKSKGISSIDYWFVTHADTDHISGVLEVLESGFPVKHLVVAEAALKDENYTMLVSVADKNRTQILHMKAGDRICSEYVSLQCLYPGTTEISDRNEASLVLELELFGEEEQVCLRGLFTGDISSETEAFLLEQGLLQDVDVYKVAHHGSKYSSSEAFLQAIQPEISVVSCSKNNIYGHPAKETIERLENVGSTVYYTMESGQVTITTEKVVFTFKESD